MYPTLIFACILEKNILFATVYEFIGVEKKKEGNNKASNLKLFLLTEKNN